MGFRGGYEGGYEGEGWWEDRKGVKNFVCCLLVRKGGWDRGFVCVGGWFGGGGTVCAVQYLISCLPGAPRASRVVSGKSGVLDERRGFSFGVRWELGIHPRHALLGWVGGGRVVWLVSTLEMPSWVVAKRGETRGWWSGGAVGVCSLHVGNCRAGLGEVLVFLRM